MKLYGIFDQNNNYKLLRYSNAPQEARTYQASNYPTSSSYSTVNEICLSDIEYSTENIGKNYNTTTKTFYVA
jgi:hypothetical protein